MSVAIHEIAKTTERVTQTDCRGSHIAEDGKVHPMHASKQPAANETANESPVNRHAPLPHGDNLPRMRPIIAPLEKHVIQTPTQQATYKRIKRQVDHPFRRQITSFSFQAEQPYTH